MNLHETSLSLIKSLLCLLLFLPLNTLLQVSDIYIFDRIIFSLLKSGCFDLVGMQQQIGVADAVDRWLVDQLEESSNRHI